MYIYAFLQDVSEFQHKLLDWLEDAFRKGEITDESRWDLIMENK